MKERTSIVFTLLIAMVALFTACDTTPPAPVGPSLVVTGPASDTVFTDSVFLLTVSATAGDAELSSISITENGTAIDASRITLDGFTAGSNPSPVVSTSSVTYEVGITAGSVDGETATYAVVITDVDGETASESVDIYTENAGTPVTERTMILLLNQAGPAGQGGLDLESGNQTGTQASDTDADIRDMGIDTNLPLDQNWLQQIATINGSELKVPAAGLVYEDILTSEQILAAFNDGQAFTESSKVAVGDVFLAKTSEDNYFILKTVNITVTPSDNSDSYEFSVKN